jgi:hypothetical protein
MICFAGWTALAYQPAKVPLMTVWGEKMTPETAWAEYPRPNMVRGNWQNLNGLWQYAVNKRSDARPAEWTGDILVPFCIESSLSGVRRLTEPDEQLWYRRTFTSDVNAKKERLLLNFGAVDFRTQVWVNGVEATDFPHEGGNLPFTLDITGFVKPGENELVVSVWDPSNTGGHYQALGKQDVHPNGCMYTRVSGIWQTVWLEKVPATHITGYSVVTDIDKGTVSVAVQAEGNIKDAEVEVAVYKDGRRIADGELDTWGEPVVLAIKDAQLWSPESPSLYDLKIELEADGSAKDTVTGYFGMRKIEWRKDERGVPRFYLNNAKTFMAGTLDQGWWPDGLLTPPSDEAMAWDISLLKSCGFNMMRKHIKVEPLRYYYLCDKLGILLWQDMVSGWGDTEDRYAMYRKDLKGEIDLLRNFPSIVLWVPYNESWGQPGKAKTDMTLAWVKRYDPTRLVDGPSGWNDYGTGDTRDMHNYPGPGMFPVMENRVSVLGEFGGLGYPVEGHLWIPGKSWGYVSFKTDGELMARYSELLEKLAKLARVGLSASVYTQTTDVEGEINGLVTYDRKRVKYPQTELAKLHAAVREAAKLTRLPTYATILPTSDKEGAVWQYTFDAPAAGWEKEDFDASSWKSGPAGFGNAAITKDHPNARIRTPWETPDIWLRRSFEVKEDPAALSEVSLNIFFDEDTVVYLNGVKIAAFTGFNIRYENKEIGQAAKAALKKGRNVLAVHTLNKIGGAYIDLGIDSVTYK